jgi:hypothetical protein
VLSLVHKKSRATSLQGCYAEIVLVMVLLVAHLSHISYQCLSLSPGGWVGAANLPIKGQPISPRK